ncbi:uncharacterized protein LOC130516306 isoform X4 [Takifugu flavidus]|uniref:uncharacterized protein LOC130516306 isoform X4 n=1 Tax=Takifugu flavidus TaxID=433684 RepID=UPI00254494A8|nr:uncharacterized protein LOC130516306 isoform X4 [Takifugu flavidus]
MHRTSASCLGKLASQFSTSVQKGGDTVETTESCCSFSTKGSQMKRSSRRKGDDNMMVAFKWIHAFIFLTFMLQYSDANRKYLTGHQEVTLSCENLIKDQKNCIYTTWLFSNPPSAAIELINLGQIKSDKPGRLSLSENCSLTIKNLRGEDSGLYTCRQFNSSGSQTRPDAVIDLSVVPTTITTTASIFPGTTSATPTTHHISQSKGLWWRNLFAAAALVVLTIGCLTVFIYKWRKGTGSFMMLMKCQCRMMCKSTIIIIIMCLGVIMFPRFYLKCSTKNPTSTKSINLISVLSLMLLFHCRLG